MATGYCLSPKGATLAEVSPDPEIHFFAGNTVLCGARMTDPWTINESRVTCDTCGSLLLARERQRRESVKLAVYTLTRIIRET